MKLDRNINRGGRGKYALVNMRKLIPMLDAPPKDWKQSDMDVVRAFRFLVEQGIITLGNESPGDQFFVMKYKDMFTAAGLQAYTDAIRFYLHRATSPEEADRRAGLHEYVKQMQAEADAARALGNRIPD